MLASEEPRNAHDRTHRIANSVNEDIERAASERSLLFVYE